MTGQHFCVKCGRPLHEGDIFCAKCGHPTRGQTQTAKTSAEPAHGVVQARTPVRKWKQVARVAFAVVAVFVGLILIGAVAKQFEKEPSLPPKQQKVVNERKRFAESSNLCKSFSRVGAGCLYSPDAPNSITIFIDQIKPQFRRQFASQMLNSNDLVPALRNAGFRKLTITSGGISPDFEENYDLTTNPVSKMGSDYEP